MVHATHGVPPSGPFVLEENKLDLLQPPVVHKLSISHDMPKGPVPPPVTGEGDLQGTSDPPCLLATPSDPEFVRPFRT